MKNFRKCGLKMTWCLSQSLVVVSRVSRCSKYVYLQALTTPTASTNQEQNPTLGENTSDTQTIQLTEKPPGKLLTAANKT